jgi:hypothetical protein
MCWPSRSPQSLTCPRKRRSSPPRQPPHRPLPRKCRPTLSSTNTTYTPVVCCSACFQAPIHHGRKRLCRNRRVSRNQAAQTRERVAERRICSKQIESSKEQNRIEQKEGRSAVTKLLLGKYMAGQQTWINQESRSINKKDKAIVKSSHPLI